MGLLVDAAVSLLVLAVLAAQLQAARASGVVRRGQEGNRTLPSAAALAHCRQSCGNVTFQYPFGVGPSCFHDRDFELICNESTTPPKLFFHDGITQVVDNVTRAEDASLMYMSGSDDVTYIYGNKVTVSFNRTIRMKSGVSEYNMSWIPPWRSFAYGYSWAMKVVGCDVMVKLVDPKSGASLGTCASFCPNEEITEMSAIDTCNSIGCCEIYINTSNATFHGFHLKVNLLQRNGSNPKPHSSGSSMQERVNVVANSQDLVWAIVDQPTCDSSKLTYACIGSNSECSHNWLLNGHTCRCKRDYIGNPYILDGCSAEEDYNPNNLRAICNRSCGNISVPFPFGLEEGCSARKIFQLNCTNPSSSILVLSDDTQVTSIDIDQGLIQCKDSSVQNQYHPNFISDSRGAFLPPRGSASASVPWVAANISCSDAQRNGYACRSEYSQCVPVQTNGYRCKCLAGFKGNPYIKNGCQDINECLQTNKCKGICRNTKGSYKCIENLLLGALIGLIGTFGILLLIFAAIFFILRRKRYIRKKEQREHFKKNHGLLLEQLISSDENASNKTKIFSLQELERATNTFDPTRILGRGGHGMVYKGILSDQRVVAIKKSNVIKDGEINQFINEVAILSQINHRNIVKLFGCCLETEVPLLVYDFVPNGSLFQILHADTNTGFSLTWENCLRIAAETAGALYYLRAAASISIFHRDVKSANILLDGNYTAKVSDFGASRSVPIDQTHVVTNVQGTYGYLDPEYYYTGLLNEKSDVYSFGVMLVELLLKKKPIFVDESGMQQNLSQYFLGKIKAKQVGEIISAQVLEEATEEEIEGVCSLAEMCLRPRGNERPTMKDVEGALQLLRTERLSYGQTGPGKYNEGSTMLITDTTKAHCQPSRVCPEASSEDNYKCRSLEQEYMSSIGLPR